MSEDGSSLLEGLANAAGTVVANAFDTLGWVLPALFLSVLFLAVLAGVCWLLDDIPFEALGGFPSIFRWARDNFGPGDGPRNQLLSVVPKPD